MSEDTKPSESTPASLAALLRSRTADASASDAASASDRALPADPPAPPAPQIEAAASAPRTADGDADADADIAAPADLAVSTPASTDADANAQADASDAPAPPVDDTADVVPIGAAAGAATIAAHAPAPAATEPAPSFMRATRTTPVRTRTPRWQWGAAGALAVVLALQVVVADRVRLAADAGWRPLVSGVCTLLRCSLPAWHQPEAFTMLTREVRPLPGQSGVLQIQASFRNDARWAQAWPSLQLALSDADGRVIGSRVFAPADYLGHAPPPGDTLAPGQSTQIAFRVREPAASTAAFNFEFH
jgi:hypothetical protein